MTEETAGSSVQAAIWQANVARVDLDAMPFAFRHNRIGALLARLLATGPDQQRQRGLRLAIQQFAHQPRPQKAGCAGDKNEFFVFHAEPTSVCAQFEGRKR